MADYSRQLFDMFGSVGDAWQEKRNYAAKLQESADRNMRDDRRFDYQVKNDDRNYLRQLGIDDANADYRNQSLDLQRRSVERQEAIAARPNIETFYTPEGQETRGIYDPESPTGFRPVGGAKTSTANIPNGYQPRPNGGGLTFTPGGPADPAVIANLASVRNEGKPGRPLPAMTIKDLGTKGQAVDDLNRLTEGFQDGYGGYKTSWGGDVSNAVGRNWGLGLGEQANWWQDYQSRKNVVRNQLFGSALTAQEKGEFDKADISPGMTPATIRQNLARQQTAVTNAARKMATALAKQNYSREAIEAALGMSLDDLGGGPSGNSPQQQAPSYQPQDIEAEMRRRGMMR